MKKKPKYSQRPAVQARRKHLSATSAEMKKKARERVARWRAEKKEKVRHVATNFEQKWKTKLKQKKKKPMATQTTKTNGNETKKPTAEEKAAEKAAQDNLMPEPTKVYKGDGVTPDLSGTDQEAKKK